MITMITAIATEMRAMATDATQKRQQLRNAAWCNCIRSGRAGCKAKTRNTTPKTLECSCLNQLTRHIGTKYSESLRVEGRSRCSGRLRRSSGCLAGHDVILRLHAERQYARSNPLAATQRRLMKRARVVLAACDAWRLCSGRHVARNVSLLPMKICTK